LRSLRDLEAERSAGDIDEVDFVALKEDYTARAADVLRRLRALDGVAGADAAEAGPETSDPAGGGVHESTGDPKATVGHTRQRRWNARGFKVRRKPLAVGVAAAVAIGIAVWALTAALGSRAPGQVISGQAIGNEGTAQLLLEAQQATAKGDAVHALQDYRKILAKDPAQVEALTGEGWLLVQTQQPNLFAQGLGLLTAAEQADPTYGLAHAYRGAGLLAEGDNVDAIPELQYYLSHNPDPALAPKMRQALQQAQAAVAKKGSKPAGK
jgi:tetratricopeptide (TPR) repeat protein